MLEEEKKVRGEMGTLGGGFGKPGARPPSLFIPLFALNLTTPTPALTMVWFDRLGVGIRFHFLFLWASVSWRLGLPRETGLAFVGNYDAYAYGASHFGPKS